MRVLFNLEYPGYLRYFDSTIDLMVNRGWEVVVLFDRNSYPETLEALAKHGDKVKIYLQVSLKRGDLWHVFAMLIRVVADYVRYLHPRYRDATYLRARMGRMLPRVIGFLNYFRSWPRWLVGYALRVLTFIEQAIPSARKVEGLINEIKPDVVIVSPLITLASYQTDVVKSCQKMGIPVALCVASWDHLTTKGYLRIKPDRVFVWNDVQKREAVELLHHVDSDIVTVTGAQPFDKWFGRSPTLSREDFCTQVGLDPAKPFLMFVGSTASITPPELELRFVGELIARLRLSNDAVLHNMGVLMRPHPYNRQHWDQADFSRWSNVTIWPKKAANPVNEDDRDDYFHSLKYAATVIGINTSAMVEAAILEKPVLTVQAPEFGATQGGTLHFHYLLKHNNGFVESFGNMDDAIARAREIVIAGFDPEPTRDFVRSFIRPRGLDYRCTEILVGNIESLARAPSVRPRSPAIGPMILRPAIWGGAVLLAVMYRLMQYVLSKERAKDIWIKGGRNTDADKKQEPA